MLSLGGLLRRGGGSSRRSGGRGGGSRGLSRLVVGRLSGLGLGLAGLLGLLLEGSLKLGLQIVEGTESCEEKDRISFVPGALASDGHDRSHADGTAREAVTK